MSAPDGTALAFERADGRVGCRNHVLVLPSVVCATRVARDIARDTGCVALTHQHGCSQIGDDEVQTAAALESIACNPNVAGVVVVSLGCETVQGRELARRIGERGQVVELVGIQDGGGSEAAVVAGRDYAASLGETAGARSRVPVGVDRLVVGIEASRDTPTATALARLAVAAGAALVLGDDCRLPPDLLARCRRVDAFTAAAPADGTVLVLAHAGSAAEQHTALVAAGAHVVVSFPADENGPAGFPLCPVVSVAGTSPLHRALVDDFDAAEPVTPEWLWRRVVEVASGAGSVAETLGLETFALARLARSM